MYGIDDKTKAEVEGLILSKLACDNVLPVLFATSKIAPRLKAKCTNFIEHNIGSVS